MNVDTKLVWCFHDAALALAASCFYQQNSFSPKQAHFQWNRRNKTSTSWKKHQKVNKVIWTYASSMWWRPTKKRWHDHLASSPPFLPLHLITSHLLLHPRGVEGSISCQGLDDQLASFSPSYWVGHTEHFSWLLVGTLKPPWKFGFFSNSFETQAYLWMCSFHLSNPPKLRKNLSLPA